jgi:hypothetical protein
VSTSTKRWPECAKNQIVNNRGRFNLAEVPLFTLLIGAFVLSCQIPMSA